MLTESIRLAFWTKLCALGGCLHILLKKSMQLTHIHTHTHAQISFSICGDWFGSLTRGLSEIPSTVLRCRHTLDTKPVSSTSQVRGQVSCCFMVSIRGSKPDTEPVGEWGKWQVWLTCCLAWTCGPASSSANRKCPCKVVCLHCWHVPTAALASVYTQWHR